MTKRSQVQLPALVPQAKTKNLKLDKILFLAVKCVTELIMCCTGYWHWHLTLLPVNYILAQGWIWLLSVLSVTLMQWWTVVRHTKVNRCVIHLDIHPTPQELKYFPNNLLQILAHAKGGPRLRVCARKNPKFPPPLDLQQHRRRRPKKIKII